MSPCSRRSALQLCSTVTLGALAGCQSLRESISNSTKSQSTTPDIDLPGCDSAWEPAVEWEQPLPSGQKPHQLVVNDDTLYVATSNDVFALSLADGAIQWRTAPSSRIVGVDDDHVYVNNVFNFRTFDAASGEQVWRFEIDEGTKVSAADYMDGVVYLVAQKHPGAEDSFEEEFDRLYALDATTGDVRWQHEQLASSGNDWNLHADHGTVYVNEGKSAVLQAFEPDGTERWQATLDNSLILVESTPDNVYVNDSAHLIKLSASDGTQQWQYPGCEDSAIRKDGRFYCATGSSKEGLQYAVINATSGENHWQTDYLTPKLSGRLAVTAGTLFVPYDDNNSSPQLLAFNPTEGCLLGRFTPKQSKKSAENPDTGVSALAATDGTVYLAIKEETPRIYALAGGRLDQ